MISGRKKVKIMPFWPLFQASQEVRKCLVRKGAYISVPLERALDGPDKSDYGAEAADKPLGAPEVYGIRSAGGCLDLITNLITSFEKHGKHGIHGKVVVNERISLR
jgi:hypothetical protein